MAILNSGDKVVFVGNTGEFFKNGNTYTFQYLKNGTIMVSDEYSGFHPWNTDTFITNFSLPNTLQVSQDKEDIRSYNVGASDYSKHKIQPWDIILEYNLNYWDGDIVKRILRTKETDGRRLDYEKIIHIAKERIRQIDAGYE